jgi:hypothetical protein
MKPKFDASVAWLEPFWEASKDLISPRIQRIRGYQVPLNKEHRCEAQITQWTKGRYSWFVIALATHVHQVCKGEKCQKKKVSGYLLRDFAHELAHTRHMDHSPDHWELQCKIERRFSKVLRELGVKDTDVRRPLLAKKEGSI